MFFLSQKHRQTDQVNSNATVTHENRHLQNSSSHNRHLQEVIVHCKTDTIELLISNTEGKQGIPTERFSTFSCQTTSLMPNCLFWACKLTNGTATSQPVNFVFYQKVVKKKMLKIKKRSSTVVLSCNEWFQLVSSCEYQCFLLGSVGHLLQGIFAFPGDV